MSDRKFNETMAQYQGRRIQQAQKVSQKARRASSEMAAMLALGKAEKQKAKKQGVSIAPGGYPTVRESLERDSLMLSAPTLRTYVKRAPRPNLQYRANGDCQIHHREYLMDVLGSVAQVITPIPINPGLNGSFPWLSRIASNYESYRFNSLKFHYETEASTASTGTLILTIDYDAADDPPTTKTQALSFRGCVRSAPWSPCIHTSISEDLNKRKTYYCRSGGLKTGQDVTFYDIGNLFVITAGQGGASAIGELWVEYDILLMGPKALSAGGGNSIWSSYNATNRDTMAVFGSGNLPATVVNATNSSTFTFSQPWSGEVVVQLNGTGIGTANIVGANGVVVTSLARLTSAAQDVVIAIAQVNVPAAGTVAAPATVVVSLSASTTIVSGGMNFTQGFGALN